MSMFITFVVVFWVGVAVIVAAAVFLFIKRNRIAKEAAKAAAQGDDLVQKVADAVSGAGDKIAGK